MTDVKTAIVPEFPDCDICKMEGKDPPDKAGYDGATSFGRWGYMCESHFQKHGKGLGHGIGQKLVLESPEPQSRKDKADDLCELCSKDCPDDCWNKDTGRYRVLDSPEKVMVMLSLGMYCEEV